MKNKTKTIIKRTGAILLAAVILAVGLFVFKKDASAWGESVTFDNSGIFFVTIDDTSARITGSYEGNEFDHLHWSTNNDFSDLSATTVGEATLNTTDETFSAIIPIGNGFNPDADGETVYFQITKSDGSIVVNSPFGNNSPRATVKLQSPEIVLANTSYDYDGSAIPISGTIENTISASKVFLSDNLYLSGNHPINGETSSNVTQEQNAAGEDIYTFSLSASDITGFNNGQKTLALYAIDASDNIIAKKEITINENPKLTVNNTTIEVDLTQYYGSESISFGVSGYKNNAKIGYTLTDYSNETDESVIINALTGIQNVDQYNSNTNVSFSLNSFTLQGTDVYFYLFRGTDILDSKTITVKRKQLDIDSASFNLVDSDKRATDTIFLKIGESTANAGFLLSNVSNRYGQVNPWYSINNPYRVYIVEKQTGNFANSGNNWDREGQYQNFNYWQNIQINNLNYLPRDGRRYIAYLEYQVNGSNNYVRIDKSVEFLVKNEIPEMTWESSEVTDKIILPIYKDKITANVTGWRQGDFIAWTTESKTGTALTEWASGNPASYRINQYSNRVDFPIDDLPRVDSNCYFYLVRPNANEDPEVFLLGNYPVAYREQVNHFGLLNRELPLDNKIYVINNTNWYFSGALQESQAHTIEGYFENGLGNDEVAWSADDLTDEEMNEWTANEKIHAATMNFTQSPENAEKYLNIYSFSLDSLSFAADIPYTVHVYTRRNTGNGTYSFKNLGEINVSKAHNPELISVNSESNYYFGNDGTVLKDISITLEANDIDTGVKEVILYYKKDGEEKKEELYYVVHEDWYTPNQIVSISKKLEGIKNDEDKYISIYVKNFSGRETTYEGLFANKPELSVKPVNVLESFSQKDYYTADSRNENFEIKASKSEGALEEDSSQIAILSVFVNGNPAINNNYQDQNVYEIAETLNMNSEYIADAEDNKYNVHIRVTNKAGNVVENNFVFEVDANTPEITGFVVNKKEMSADADTSKYTFITNQKIETEIKAKDSGSGGLKDIRYYWVESSGSKSSESKQSFENHPDTASTKTTKDSSFKGFLYANADDCVGNSAEKDATFGGIILEKPDKHNSENHIDIGVPSTGAKDAKGNPLYNSAANFSIKVFDNFSGIRSVEWRVSCPHDKSAENSGTLSINEGSLSDTGWNKNSFEKNIVTSVSKQITVDGNSDDFVLFVKMTDNAGNTSEKSVTFSIDKVKPTVSVTYGNQKGDPDFNNYYAEARTATIVVKERNFNQDSANSMVSNTLGNKGTLSAWKENRDAENPDNSTYTATITFDKEDRYNLSYQCSDKAGNTSDSVSSPEFVIDKTVPEVSVVFEKGNNKNGFYGSVRTATISVKDVNFDASRISVIGISGQTYTLSNWTRKENTFSTLMTFSKDGEFAFDVTAKDKAGNQGNSVHVNTFTIDLKSPEIVIEGVTDKSAYNSTVAPKITFKDTNIDKDTISVELNGAINGRVDLTDKYTVSEDGLVYTFRNIEDVKENDDLYTLRASVKDKAGNTTVKEVEFSVNRFGSIYILGDNLKNINDKYVKSVKDIEITEVNVNKIKKGSVVITLSVNGTPNTLSEGTDYTVEAKESAGDWKQYVYKFNDSLFAKDGSYILTVVSEDEAGNKNNSVNENKEAEVKFGVDATAPIIAPVNFESNQYFESNNIEFSVSVKDNMILDSVTVLVNGQAVNCTQNEEIYSFHVDESNKRQEIKVIATDLAGNEAIESYEGILIAGNIWVRFIHNKLAVIISSATAGTLVLGGGILITILTIRKFH